MEKFTKEKIETAEKLYELWAKEKYTSPTFKSFLNSLNKPERKKIVVEIEYDDFNNNKIGVGDVKTAIENYSLSSHWNFKVTELPEVFTREQVIGIFDASFTDKNYIDGLINKWLSKRNK
jgi:hypothetical protein